MERQNGKAQRDVRMTGSCRGRQDDVLEPVYEADPGRPAGRAPPHR